MFLEKRTTSTFRRQVLAAAILGLLLGLTAMVRSAVTRQVGDDNEAAPSKANGEKHALFDPSKTVGQMKCVDCHRSEVAVWQKTTHAGKVFDLLLGDTAEEYAEKMGITVEALTRSSMCLNCHATPANNRLGHPKPIMGVSCEACHNPAGGDRGWLNAHAVYGPIGTSREDESADHYQRRAERCAEAGQLRSSDLYLLAKRCFACHIVGDEKLINVGGHKLSGDRFTLLAKMSGEIRHNFHVNQSENAVVSSLWTDPLRHPNRSAEARMKMLAVVGHLVKSEMICRNRATADDAKGNYAVQLADLFDASLGDLEDSGVDVLSELAESQRELCDRLLDQEDVDDEDLLEAAEAFARLARQYAAGEGDGLENVDISDIDDELKKAHQR